MLPNNQLIKLACDYCKVTALKWIELYLEQQYTTLNVLAKQQQGRCDRSCELFDGNKKERVKHLQSWQVGFHWQQEGARKCWKSYKNLKMVAM